MAANQLPLPSPLWAAQDCAERHVSHARSSQSSPLLSLTSLPQHYGLTGQTVVAVTSGANMNFDRLRLVAGELRGGIALLSAGKLCFAFRWSPGAAIALLSAGATKHKAVEAGMSFGCRAAAHTLHPACKQVCGCTSGASPACPPHFLLTPDLADVGGKREAMLAVTIPETPVGAARRLYAPCIALVPAGRRHLRRSLACLLNHQHPIHISCRARLWTWSPPRSTAPTSRSPSSSTGERQGWNATSWSPATRSGLYSEHALYSRWPRRSGSAHKLPLNCCRHYLPLHG